MSQASPVEIMILLKLRTMFQAISKAAGYNYDLKSTSVVIEATAALAEVPMAELPYIVVGDELKETNREFATSRPTQLKQIFQFIIKMRVDAAGGTGDGQKQLALAQLLADVELAITQDITLGGLVLYTKVLEAERYFGPPANQMTFARQPIEVQLARTYGRP